MINEDDVQKLAELQEELKSAEDKIAADPTIKEYTEKIAELEKQVSKHRDAVYDLKSVYMQEHIEAQIKEAKEQIIFGWTGEKNTLVFDVGTLKFRTTKSLKVVNGGRLLEHIIKNTSTDEAVDKYLQGFRLMPTKAYVDVHGLGAGIARIEPKTTVVFKQKSE